LGISLADEAKAYQCHGKLNDGLHGLPSFNAGYLLAQTDTAPKP
jgi:hypothetical protein